MVGKDCQRKSNEGRTHTIIEEDLKNSIRNESERKKCKDLLQNLLVNEPSNRFKIGRVSNHPFFTGEIQCDFWNRCLAIAGDQLDFNIDIDRNEKFDKCFCEACFD